MAVVRRPDGLQAGSPVPPAGQVSRVRYHQVEPEVAGGTGPGTVFVPGAVPWRVARVHYVFDDWFGDWLVTSTPVFVATREAADLLADAGLTGFVVREAQVSTSELFEEINPGRALPQFVWLDIHARAGEADLGLTERNDLVVSDAALDLLRSGICHAQVTDIES
jgi:hypothetical protein